MRRDFMRRAAYAATVPFCLLLAACAGTVPVDDSSAPWTLVIVTAARGRGIQIDRMPVDSLEACAAIEQVVAAMRAAGVDRLTTARCEAGDAAI